uniref:Beta-glucosidase n=1 Tax=Steinernema glaseri TaxID=37863 RepID=A0A1I7XZY6_9BILA
MSTEIKVFPEGFIWSVATSAFQIEGAAREDGKGPSIWDAFTHREGNIADGSNADVACDSYHKAEEDIRMLKQLGVQQYRFSLSWPRLLPNGKPSEVNPKGVEYYNKLIDGLVAAGIEPLVTLYHWDLPLALNDRGGWLTSEIAEWFADYARFCFRTFGDRVKKWATLNEPWTHVSCGYNGDLWVHAPGKFAEFNEWVPYLAAHNMLRAHAKAYRVYDKEFRGSQAGQVGLVNIGLWYEPLNPESEADKAAAYRSIQMQLGWFLNPIYHPEGDYPAIMKQRMKENSEKEGRVTSRLPEFTPEELEELKGSSDFLGLNYYITYLVRDRTEEEMQEKGIRRRLHDAGTMESSDPAWKHFGPDYSPFRSIPWGLRRLLKWIKEEYGNPTVMITENGVPQREAQSDYDKERMEVLSEHIEALHEAIVLDGCNVIGYTVWSLMDNYEWAGGYELLFGLFSVDFRDPERKRTPRASARWYQKVVKTNSLVPILGEDCMDEEMD